MRFEWRAWCGIMLIEDCECDVGCLRRFEGQILIVGFAGGRIASVATNRLLLKQISVVGVYFGSYQKHDPQKLSEAIQVAVTCVSVV